MVEFKFFKIAFLQISNYVRDNCLESFFLSCINAKSWIFISVSDDDYKENYYNSIYDIKNLQFIGNCPWSEHSGKTQSDFVLFKNSNSVRNLHLFMGSGRNMKIHI